MYWCFGTDEHIDTYIQQNKPQNSVASTDSTGCSKARSAVIHSSDTTLKVETLCHILIRNTHCINNKDHE